MMGVGANNINGGCMSDLDEREELQLDGAVIPHKKSPNFSDEFANGMLIVGPTVDNLYLLTFYMESADITQERIRSSSETKGLNGNLLVETFIDPSDIETFREDKVRITLTKDALLKLKELLNTQFP